MPDRVAVKNDPFGALLKSMTIDPPAGRLSAMVSSVLTVPQNLIDTSAAAVPPWPSATV